MNAHRSVARGAWRVVAILFALVALGVCARPVSAQTAQAPPPAGPRTAGQAPADQPPPTAADIQAWFDAMVLVQAQRALRLTDAQYPQFVGRVKALQDTRRRNQRERNQLVQEIQRILSGRNGPVDETQLRERLKALDDLQPKAAAEVRKAYENLDQVLDLRQQARFRVFEEQIERRRFEILLNARRGRGGRQ
jgi:hypothetical protein